MKQNWGLPNNTRGILVWISSPNYDKSNRVRINVFFRLEDGGYRHAWLMWSQLPYLHLGYIYKNNDPPKAPKDVVSGKLTNNEIKNAYEDECVKIKKTLFSFLDFKTASGIPSSQDPMEYVKNSLKEKCIVVHRTGEII